MIGFPPRYGTTYDLENRTSAEQLMIAWMAVEKMNWEISTVTPDSLTAFTNFSLRSWNEQVSIRITEEGLELFSVSTGVQVLDFFRNRQNIRRLLKEMDLINANTSTEQLAAQYEERKVQLDRKEDFVHLTHNTRIVSGFMNVFRPVKGYFITPILITLQVLIFLLLTNKWLFPESTWWTISPQALLDVGANYKPLTLFGQPWRLLTANFLHADVLHLFFNMYGLMVCGIYLESLLGRWRFLLIYLLCGIGGGIASLWWHDRLVSVGASGAVFGLFGFILTLLLHRFLQPGERKALLISIGIYLVFSFSAVFFADNFDHAWHIGGLLTGAVLALGIYPNMQTRTVWVAGLMTSLFIGIWFMLPRDVNIYIEKLEKMDENFVLAAVVYNNQHSGEERKKLLKDYGIYYMNENLRIMDEIDQLSLSADSRNHNKLLRRLITTQKSMYNYSYKTLEEGKNRYDKEILEAIHELSRMQKQLGD
ncbi:rhomboid family intramembrane serine protease [Chitinophaga sp. SYP-B3965]|uniref:rhomboid family intramembrane serine protease n=1 Tax=Chitinophaga sp. SYP-B3965 TaxID=2663120 RepID=UPI001299972C|nr:rhomboid family intramembrane serine protease [Chitinophaga sp. SYP-B3965]MRG46374.1 rhomboid family intramembrane serine protease [Chitinophaga sp. SYP-B3965]